MCTLAARLAHAQLTPTVRLMRNLESNARPTTTTLHYHVVVDQSATSVRAALRVHNLPMQRISVHTVADAPKVAHEIHRKLAFLRAFAFPDSSGVHSIVAVASDYSRRIVASDPSSSRQS